MKGLIFSDYGRLFDHDVIACPVCQPKNDHFLDGPCPECGHIWDDMVTVYAHGYKSDVLVCHRCRITMVVYSGSTLVLAFKQVPAAPDLSGYRHWSDRHWRAAVGGIH